MDYNKVLLIGNLTRDPELRYIGSGTAVCDLGMAINRRFQRSDGERGEETCFVDVVVWGRQGESCNQYLKKGAGVFVEGRLTLDTWQTQEGQKRSKHKVVADRVQFMPRGGARSEGEVSEYGSSHRSDSGPAGPPAGGGEGTPEYDSEVPF